MWSFELIIAARRLHEKTVSSELKESIFSFFFTDCVVKKPDF
jgi:hypothetical protein